jgi:DNA polymerase (family X)
MYASNPTRFSQPISLTHSPLNWLDERRVVEFARDVRKINRRGLGIRVFSGLKCDIMKDGLMDVDEGALAELDLAIGSVQGHMKMEAAEITGRLLLNRDAFPFDFDTVGGEAARRGGAKFTISTDAHHPKHLANMRFGVTTARRGWLGAADILNTLPVDEFARAIRAKDL